MLAKGHIMRYVKFEIQNFKGVKHAVVDLSTLTRANVFTLVGLNESGKTTILEAIYSFSPDHRTRTLRGTTVANAKDAATERLPRHLLAHFSGEIMVKATLALDEKDKHLVVSYLKSEYDITLDAESIPDQIALARSDIFKRGDYVNTTKSIDQNFLIKKGRQKAARTPNADESSNLYSAFWAFTPDIAYHDSFLFDFPDRIYLTNRPGTRDLVYRQMFEDVLAAGKIPYHLSDITRRVKEPKYKIPWPSFFNIWTNDDDKNKVQQIIDQASQTITEIVLGKWNKIFGETPGDKEIIVQFGVEKGRKWNSETKVYEDIDDHDIYVSLEIKHGTRRFPIKDRSLGFRWFFAFLLFTQFRASGRNYRPVLFLFDEPAANLHAAAQKRLVESFPEIATGNNMLMYSTHSHYMISPDWLEQTFIVTNNSDLPSDGILQAAVRDEESLDVKVDLYRQFANNHPNDTSYFQPIIDRLDVVPSTFDISLPSVILEGKSDYYVLRYACHLHNLNDLRFLPASGAGTFGSLISIGSSWGTKFLFLLDGDGAGLKEQRRYAEEHGARHESLVTLTDFASKINKIEHLIDDEARQKIKNALGTKKVTKTHIMRFFQESLSKNNIIDLGDFFRKNTLSILEGLHIKLKTL